MLPFLDSILYLLHFCVLAFALSGWAHVRTRQAHRWLLAGVGTCWLVIGPLTGEAGYCPLTDLHWRVKRAMGAELPQHGWIDDICARLGLFFNAQMVDIAATCAFVVLMGLALLQWRLEREYRMA